MTSKEWIVFILFTIGINVILQTIAWKIGVSIAKKREVNWTCSNCGKKNEFVDFDFCPNCGADMRPKANQLRDCENCVHHSDNGCEVWECEFEKRSDL